MNSTEVAASFASLESQLAEARQARAAALTVRDEAQQRFAALTRASLEAGSETYIVQRAWLVERAESAGAAQDVLGSQGPAFLTRQGTAAIVATAPEHLPGLGDLEARLEGDEMFATVLLVGGERLVIAADSAGLDALRVWLGRAVLPAKGKL